MRVGLDCVQHLPGYLGSGYQVQARPHAGKFVITPGRRNPNVAAATFDKTIGAKFDVDVELASSRPVVMGLSLPVACSDLASFASKKAATDARRLEPFRFDQTFVRGNGSELVGFYRLSYPHGNGWSTDTDAKAVARFESQVLSCFPK